MDCGVEEGVVEAPTIGSGGSVCVPTGVERAVIVGIAADVSVDAGMVDATGKSVGIGVVPDVPWDASGLVGRDVVGVGCSGSRGEGLGTEGQVGSKVGTVWRSSSCQGPAHVREV